MYRLRQPVWVTWFCIAATTFVTFHFHSQRFDEIQKEKAAAEEVRQIQIRNAYTVEAEKIAETCEREPENQICGGE